jgi:hypothetical protein
MAHGGRRRTPEGYVLDAVMDYLAAKKIFRVRMNSGAIKLDSQNGRTRYFKGHEAGTADVLALNIVHTGERELCRDREIVYWEPVWIECKADKGKQSDLQKQFQEKVEAEGHKYILAYGIEDLEKAGL